MDGRGRAAMDGAFAVPEKPHGYPGRITESHSLLVRRPLPLGPLPGILQHHPLDK